MCFGDGNCLFRAVSIILFRNEDHHTELSTRSILELANNETKYFYDNYLQSLMGAYAVVRNLLPSSVHFISRNPSCYWKEVLRTIRFGTFANMWHIFGLANVLGFPGKSVYPDVQNAGTDRALMNVSMTPLAFASHCSNSTKKGGVQIIYCPFYLPRSEDVIAKNGLPQQPITKPSPSTTSCTLSTTPPPSAARPQSTTPPSTDTLSSSTTPLLSSTPPPSSKPQPSAKPQAFHLMRSQKKQVKGWLSTTVVSKRHGPKNGASL